MNQLRLFFCASLLLFANQSYAIGIPTIDVANILQTTTNDIESIKQNVLAANQLAQLKMQLEQQIQQVKGAEQQLLSMTGSRGMGQLLTNSQKAADRRMHPNDLSDMIYTIENGGVLSNHRYNAIVTDAKADMGYKTSQELNMADSGALSGHSKIYDQSSASNIAAVSMGEAYFSDTDTRTGEIEALMAQIDQAQDQKASLDLINTMLAQMLVLQNEQLRLQSLILQNQGATNQFNMQAVEQESSFMNKGFRP